MTTLAEQLATAIARHPGGELLSGDLSEGFDEPARDAAVLVAITDRPRPGLILTERHADLAGEQNVLAGLGHGAVGGGTNKNGAVHLGGVTIGEKLHEPS